MKLKLLLMPLLLVSIVGLMIWLVYPSYTNGIDGLKEKNAELKKEREKLNAIKAKISKANTMASQLETMPTKDILYQFLPEGGMEEKIIDRLNFSGSNAGVAMYALKMTQPRNVVLKDAPPFPKSENILGEVGLAGSYEKIRDFVIAMEKDKRHNDILGLKISKEKDANVLTTEFKMNFQKLEKVKLSEKNMEDAVFDKPFDTAVIDEIIRQRDAAALDLFADQKGKANPFTP